MKSIRLILSLLIALLRFSALTILLPTFIHAGDTQIVGDLKVDGLYFSGDPNKTVITKPSDFSLPWTINNLNIYYLLGNVGIGTPTPSQKLEVSGTVKAAAFQGDGSGLTNVLALIADNSITDAKIFGRISSSKLDLTGVQKKIGKVAIVAQSGGDYTDPVAAMDGLASWCGAPSSSNPCILKIMPGVYTVTSPVQMQPYVDIEGSGERVTRIISALSSSLNHYTVATVLGANNAELRFLTVENTGTGTHTTAIANTSASPSLVHVTANASGGTNSSCGLANYYSSSATVINVTVNASGPSFNFGIENYHSSPMMTNVAATVSGGASFNYGVKNSYSSPVMTNVTVAATGVTGVGISNYSSSPLMLNIVATATGTLQAIGVENNTSSSPTMANVIASASGGASFNHGVNNSYSSPIMTNVTTTATGGAGSNSGVYNPASSTTMTNVTAIASGGSRSYGVYSWLGATVRINHSVIKGTTNSIFNDNDVTIFVGNTQLDGGAVQNSGTLTCVGVYNGTYTALNNTCQ